MSKKYIGKTCPYCKTPLVEGDTVVFCSVCDMPHHLSCWQDNQGCTTFGCTGSIKEIIGNDSGVAAAPAASQPIPAPVAAPNPVEAVPAKSAPAPVEQAEKPIEILYESKEMVFMSDVPLVLENTAIIIDRTKDKLFARCTFRSITDKAIKAVLIEISCQDVWGSTLGEPIAFQYLDLRTKRESKFGQTNPIELADKTTRKISVLVKKILFADGSIITGGDKVLTMAAPVLLSQHLKSKELAAEYARETTNKAQFVPESLDSYWRCTCGSVNIGSDDSCYHCGSSKDGLIAALNPELLHANMVSFQAEKRAAEEKARAEQAERIRLAEEQVRLERERKEREILEAERAKQEKKRRTRKTIIAIVSAILAVALICGIVFWGIPYLRYQSACTALENGDYDTAYQTFVDLDDFMDSSTMANEALYQKGKAALANNQYDDAISIFTELGSYSDSKAMLSDAKKKKENAEKEARYQEGLKALSDKQYDTAIEIFSGLGNYSDSKDKLAEAKRYKENAAKETRYQEGIAAFNNGQYDEAIAIFTELGNYAESKTKLAEAQAKKEELAKQARYQEGITALNNKQYDTAIAIFTELGDFSDSKAKLTEAQNKRKEVRYQEGVAALSNKQYDTAITIFTELGSYSDSKDKLTEAKYEQANILMASQKYETAYKYFKDVGNYRDAQSKLTPCLYGWADIIAASSKKAEAEKFKSAVTLSSEHYSTIYAKIWNRINSHTDFDYWDDYWNNTENASVVYAMLQTLPSSYEETSTLCKLFNVLVNGDIHPVADYIRNNKSFIKSVWHIGFMQNFVARDEMITVFLEDYWTTSSGDYYMHFYTEENPDSWSSTSCVFTLPRVDKPAGTQYYDVVSQTFIWTDDNDTVLAKVLSFTIVDFNTVKVYCYKDGNTYTLYRQ